MGIEQGNIRENCWHFLPMDGTRQGGQDLAVYFMSGDRTGEMGEPRFLAGAAEALQVRRDEGTGVTLPPGDKVWPKKRGEDRTL